MENLLHSKEIKREGRKIKHRPFGERATMFGSALAFRGSFFPQVRKRDWVVLLLQHSRTIVGLVVEGLKGGHLQTARWARARPEVEHHRLAP